MFFFKLVPEEEFSKDCFMKQKPFNDNLVMASIESLYEQASHTVRPIQMACGVTISETFLLSAAYLCK